MLKSGREHLEQLRDGRKVFIGKEPVDDVTTHPAFRNAAATVAAIYDMKADPDRRELMSFEENGERYSMYFLKAQSREDLERRMKAHKAIADMTYGLFGRSPDHVASFVTGMAMKPDELVAPYAFADNLAAYYEEMRKQDHYTVYAVLPPQAARNPEFYERKNVPVPSLHVVREEDDGVVISGMKMLATGAVFANEIWIGNVLPIAESQKREAITCAVPVNAPGLSLWSRKALEPGCTSEFDSPLSYRYDETDSMVMCDQVKVPWERVFVHDDALLSRSVYVTTPSHCYGNHQSNVRFWSKMQLILGLCSKVAASTGANKVPAVAEVLGKMSAQEAAIAGMIHGQINAYESWPDGYATFNRRMMYAALDWCTQNHSAFIDELRQLCGGGVFQMPADISVMGEPAMADDFVKYWDTPQCGAVERMKLFKLAWDLVGSEFAGRHQQYEKFYAGASFIVRNHSFRETDWDAFHGVVDGLMASYTYPEDTAAKTTTDQATAVA